MRYFIVKYIRKPNGKLDESVSASKKLKTRDIQTSAVILDFQTQQVLQSTLDGVTVPKDWWKIRDFYHQHYKKMIEDLEAFHGLKIVENKPDASPDTAPVSSQS
jgi:hypothetical protein